jgi:hypothetical protein
MLTIEAKCPECGLRVEVSEGEQRLIDPSSKCTQKDGWSRCSNLKPELSKARSHARKQP